MRSWPPPELPEQPYPVLLPYTHPDLLAGRERELEELVRMLEAPVPIVGLYAASGAGKIKTFAQNVAIGALIASARAITSSTVIFALS